MRCRHGLIERTAASRVGERRLVARVLVYQGGRSSGCARGGGKVMGGPVAVLRWLVDGKHPHV